jgi:hypothetical protein
VTLLCDRSCLGILQIIGNIDRGRLGTDRMVVRFTSTCAISAYHHYSSDPRSWWGVLDTTLYDKVYQWLATGRWFSSGPPDSSINNTDRHDIAEILLKVALNTINLTLSLLCDRSLRDIDILPGWYIVHYRTEHIFTFLEPNPFP